MSGPPPPKSARCGRESATLPDHPSAARSRHPDHPATHPVERLNEASFVALALTNPVNAELLQRLGGLGLPQCQLTAGCLFQAVWNRQAGRAPGWGVKDHGVFYFDGDDLSWEAENRVIRAVQARTADLGVKVEVKNQARVHLWYRDRFQADDPELTRTTDGIDRCLVACTCVGIDARTRALYAPHGLDERHLGVLRMNLRLAQPAMFSARARSYRQRWPWLSIASPEEEGSP